MLLKITGIQYQAVAVEHRQILPRSADVQHLLAQLQTAESRSIQVIGGQCTDVAGLILAQQQGAEVLPRQGVVVEVEVAVGQIQQRLPCQGGNGQPLVTQRQHPVTVDGQVQHQAVPYGNLS